MNALHGIGALESATTLSGALAGQRGEIIGIEAGCIELDQLESLGVAAGVAYSVIRGGEPIILSVLGTRVAVSGELAGRILVSDWARQ